MCVELHKDNDDDEWFAMQALHVLGDKLDENRHNHGWFKINFIDNVQSNFLLGEKYIH